MSIIVDTNCDRCGCDLRAECSDFENSSYMCLYKFRKRLEFDCYKDNRTLVVANEAWTSKVCGSCGNIHRDLGKSKDFDCPSCSYKADRDINASRNILSKFITNWVRKEDLPKITLG